MITGALFIGAVIAGLTQLFKLVRDKNYTGAIVIVAAALFGALVAVIDTNIGVVNISIAEGVMIGLAAAGVVAVAEKV